MAYAGAGSSNEMKNCVGGPHAVAIKMHLLSLDNLLTGVLGTENDDDDDPDGFNYTGLSPTLIINLAQ